MYKIAKALRNFLLKAPLWLCLALGKLLGLAFYLKGKKRRTAFKNAKLAFPETDDAKLRKIVRQSFTNLGLNIIEMLITPRILNHLKFLGEDYLKEAGIIIGIHEGNWEIFCALVAQRHNFAVLAKKQKNKNLDKFLNELRKEYNLTVCFSLKEIIRCLKEGFIVGIAMDHGAENNAPDVKFFSQLVPTPGGAVYLAKKFNKKIYPFFDYREHGFRHTGEIKKSVDPQNKSVAELLEEINRFYEEELKKHPREYLWSYKRFKHKKTLDIVTLSDGKLGHLKQSQAFLSFFNEENYIIRSKTINVKYGYSLGRTMADICAHFSGKLCAGCGRCLKFFLAKDTYQELKKTYADIVISTGSLTAPVNKLFSAYLGAKSVVILRPNIPLSKFDLALIPEHDRVQAPNAVKIKGALFYPVNLEDKVNQCRDFFRLNAAEKNISFLVGGPINDKKEFINNLCLFIAQLKSFAQEKNYKILISTSRRTPPDAESIIEQELAGSPLTAAIVYARRADHDFVFEGFVALGEIVFVTNESISMISETLSLGKSCVCLWLEEQSNKHNVFLESIKEETTFLKNPYNIKDTNLVVSSIFAKNKKTVKEAIKRLL